MICRLILPILAGTSPALAYATWEKGELGETTWAFVSRWQVENGYFHPGSRPRGTSRNEGQHG